MCGPNATYAEMTREIFNAPDALANQLKSKIIGSIDILGSILTFDG